MVLDVDGDKHEAWEAEVPFEYSTGDNRQLQNAAVGELNLPTATTAADSSLQILVDQF